MKKGLLVMALALGVSGAFAQDATTNDAPALTSKKGEAILPQAGDWGLSIDAFPLLRYAGNLFNSSGFNAPPTFEFLNSGTQTIVGRYFVDNQTAYRGILRIGINSDSESEMIGKANAAAVTFPAVGEMVEDKMKSSSTFIGLGAGLEKRKGSTRLQGIYGGEAMILFSGSKTKYEYGNALNPTATPAPVTVLANSYDFGSNITTDTYGNDARITEDKNGSEIGFGVRGFIGAEYFILPRFSIGGEFGWGLLISSTGKGKTTTESIDATLNTLGTQETETGKEGSFSLDTHQDAFGTGSGTLRANFYF